MSFFTEINIPEFSWKMDYSKSMMFLGSCFSENMGQKMIDLKYQVDMNPFGILYNPESIANSLKIVLEKRIFTADDLFNDQGLWNSFYHHSRFSDVNKEFALEKINNRIAQSHEFLKTLDFMVITFGSSWVYQLKKTGQIVSNCHKINASEFKRFRLEVLEVTELYHELLSKIWKLNPQLKIIFTVSPIRHWKDGAVGNQVSKATLLLAIDHLKHDFEGRGLSYFPSYELMMDELRDYRFYAEDMIHLSSVAIDYIFDRFSKFIISKESSQISNKVLKIRKAMLHRPVNVESAEYEKFLRLTLDEINQLNSNFPTLDFTEEKSYLEQKLSGLKSQGY
jgi:HAMP domain-containing protein